MLGWVTDLMWSVHRDGNRPRDLLPLTTCVRYFFLNMWFFFFRAGTEIRWGARVSRAHGVCEIWPSADIGSRPRAQGSFRAIKDSPCIPPPDFRSPLDVRTRKVGGSPRSTLPLDSRRPPEDARSTGRRCYPRQLTTPVIKVLRPIRPVPLVFRDSVLGQN